MQKLNTHIYVIPILDLSKKSHLTIIKIGPILFLWTARFLVKNTLWLSNTALWSINFGRTHLKPISHSLSPVPMHLVLTLPTTTSNPISSRVQERTIPKLSLEQQPQLGFWVFGFWSIFLMILMLGWGTKRESWDFNWAPQFTIGMRLQLDLGERENWVEPERMRKKRDRHDGHMEGRERERESWS